MRDWQALLRVMQFLAVLGLSLVVLVSIGLALSEAVLGGF